jgi:hypothetical protein
MLPKSTAMLQTEQSILGDVRGDVGKIGDKGGESPPLNLPRLGRLSITWEGNILKPSPSGEGWMGLTPVPAGLSNENCQGPR